MENLGLFILFIVSVCFILFCIFLYKIVVNIAKEERRKKDLHMKIYDSVQREADYNRV